MTVPRSTGAAFGGATAVVVAGVLGACLGWWAVRFVPPTTSEVRAAAQSLVPPGFTIKSSSAGYLSGPPTRGPYGVGIEMESAGTVDERVQAVRAQARAKAWKTVSTENFPNAVTLSFERKGIDAQVDVRLSSTSSFVGTSRQSEPDWRLKLLCASGAAALTMGLWLLVRRVFLAHRT